MVYKCKFFRDMAAFVFSLYVSEGLKFPYNSAIKTRKNLQRLSDLVYKLELFFVVVAYFPRKKSLRTICFMKDTAKGKYNLSWIIL